MSTASILARATATLAIAAPLALAASPALAELPAPARAMLDAAIVGGDAAEIAAVAKAAKAANPAHAAEVDGIVAAHQASIAAADEARKREAGMFEDWHGNGELGGFLTTGNSSTKGVSAGLHLTKDGLQWRHKLNVMADYQRAEGATTQNQQTASYEGNYKLSPRLYLFGLGMFERDKFQGFNSRFTVSGGAGYSVIANDTMTLDVKAGPAWRKTNWIGLPSTSKINALAGADFAWKVTPTVTFTDSAQALWGSGNTTYSNIAALTASLGGALSARLSYSVRHETNPPPGNEKTDTVTRATLVYGF